jgi:4a-hydroxytetrahydrobiopterin dehydratase
MKPLHNKHCREYAKHETVMDQAQIERHLTLTPHWNLITTDNLIRRNYQFKNYYATIDFVNRLAEVAHSQDHHPELLISYKNCIVSFNTHTVNGITENDFICAAKLDRLFDQKTP